MQQISVNSEKKEHSINPESLVKKRLSCLNHYFMSLAKRADLY